MSPVDFRNVGGLLIPREDGMDLCSVNAKEEASQWAKHHDLRANHAVILGLGGGFHVEAWMNAHPDARVTVIDTRASLVRPFRAAFPHLLNRMEILIFDSVDGLFSHEIMMLVARDLLPTLCFRPAMGRHKDLFEALFRALTGRSLRGLKFFMSEFGFESDFEIEMQEADGLLTIKDLGLVIDSNHEGHPRAPAVRLLRELIV